MMIYLYWCPKTIFLNRWASWFKEFQVAFHLCCLRNLSIDESDLQPPLYVPENCRHSPSTWSYHPCWVNLHYWVSRLYKKLLGVLKSIPQCNISENTRSMLLYKTSTEYFSEFQAIIALWDVFNMPISLHHERNDSNLCGICASLAVLISCSRGICITCMYCQNQSTWFGPQLAQEPMTTALAVKTGVWVG